MNINLKIKIIEKKNTNIVCIFFSFTFTKLYTK
jgi:hypothetical protein